MLGLSAEEAEGFDFGQLSQQLISLLKEMTSLNSEEPSSPEEEK